MTDAFECDRCGELYGEPPEMKVATNQIKGIGGSVNVKMRERSGTTTVGAPLTGTSVNPSYEIQRGDLCETCAEAFREFWGEDDAE